MNEDNIPEVVFQEETDVNPKKSKKRKGTALKVILVMLICIILAGLMALGGYTLYKDYYPKIQENGIRGIFSDTAEPEAEPAAEPEITEEPAPEPTEAPKISVSASGTAKSAADIYEQNVNSTVGIQTTGLSANYWGYPVEFAAAGSGIIVTKDGYIITNYHVVEDSKTIEVSTYDGKTYDAFVAGYDEANDIAVLKVEGTFTPVEFGDSDKIRVGDEVIAIGNPLGELTFSMTKGCVSSLNREVTIGQNYRMKLIQTDCPINSGNSGGALFNMNGELIGITNAKYSSSGYSNEASIEGIGFAIPINSVTGIIESIIQNGYYEKPYIGVSVTDVSSETLQVTGIDSGAIIKDIEEGSPAESAGLAINDIIVEANGKAITSYTDLSSIILEMNPGDKLTVKVYRQGKEVTLDVIIGAKGQATSPAETSKPESSAPDIDIPTPDNGNDFFDDFRDFYFR